MKISEIQFNNKLKPIMEKANKEITVKAYHGTPHDFNEFQFDMKKDSIDQFGSGLYFTSNEDIAHQYSDDGYIIEVELSFKNPILLSESDYNISNIEISETQAFNIIKYAPNIFDKYGPLSNQIDNNNKQYNINHIKQIAYLYDNLLLISNDFFYDNQMIFRNALKKVLGYDGIIKELSNGDKFYHL